MPVTRGMPRTVHITVMSRLGFRNCISVEASKRPVLCHGYGHVSEGCCVVSKILNPFFVLVSFQVAITYMARK
jgi:hypothetical protein